MSYLSLYRKWRSQDFDEVIGQEAIVKTLKNAVSMNRLSHAYLFSGPRGTGKTSTARILAKALNCEKGPTPNPCGKCGQCQKIRDGHSVDVIEIDAASNRGIDEIRDLREKVRFAPAEGKYKIYIIDEVHMLTSEAFNALLKTLEEPPAHVIFVLATTELNRVPLTILSRCQRLDFGRISPSLIIAHLKDIAGKETIDIDEEALGVIARDADGSMRDAISLLDQLVSFCGKKITIDDVVTVLGTANEELLFEFSGAIMAKDIKKTMDLAEKAAKEGMSFSQVAKDIVGHFRHMMLVKVGSSASIDLSKAYLEKLKKEAEKFSIDEIKKILLILSRAEVDMKWYPAPRLLLEVALMEAASSSAPAKTEKKAPEQADDSPVMSKKDATPERKTLSSAFNDAAGKPEKKEAPAADLLARVKKSWNNILDNLKPRSIEGYVSLHESLPVKAGEKGPLTLQFKKGYSFHKKRLEEIRVKKSIEDSLKEVLGVDMKIECVIAEDDPAGSAFEGQDGSPEHITLDDVKDIFSGKIVSPP